MATDPSTRVSRALQTSPHASRAEMTDQIRRDQVGCREPKRSWFSRFYRLLPVGQKAFDGCFAGPVYATCPSGTDRFRLEGKFDHLPARRRGSNGAGNAMVCCGTSDAKWDPYRSDPRFATLLRCCGFSSSTPAHN